MADWYVYQHDAAPLGPWSTELVADAILAGRLSPDAWIAAPGGSRWLRALDVPVIAQRIDGIPTRPRPRRDSGLRLVPGAFSVEAGRPALGATVMMVKDDEAELVPSVDAPPTEPSLPPPPPSSPTPPDTIYRGGDTLESPGAKQKNG